METLIIDKASLIGTKMTTQFLLEEDSEIVDVIFEKREEFSCPSNDWYPGVVQVPILVFANGAKMVHPDYKNSSVSLHVPYTIVRQ